MKSSALRKIVSIVLVVCLFLEINFTQLKSVFAAGGGAEGSPAGDTVEPDSDQSDSYVSTDNEEYSEITSKREQSTKYFLLESGRYEAVKYGVPVHYLLNGEYTDIDNSLSLETDKNGVSYYTNKANDYKALFAETLGGGWAAGVSKDGYEMKWALEGVGKGISADQSTYLTKDSWNQLSEGEQRRNLPDISSQVKYSAVLPETELNYQLIGNTLKENIKIYAYNGVSTIKQRISLKGLDLVQKEDGTIMAVDSRNNEIFYLLAPYAMDSGSESAYNDSIKITLTNVKDVQDETINTDPLIADAENTYILTYTLDSEWLKTATYPLTIDPTVTTSLSMSDILDTRINQNYPSQNYYNSYIMCTGHGSLSGINYSLVKFNNLPALNSAEMVVYSGLRLKKPSASSAASIVSVQEITSSWVETTVTWNTKPSFSNIVEDYSNVGTAAGDTYEWNITHIAKKWYNAGTNYGLLLKGITDSTAYSEWYTTSATFGDVPYAYFVYVNYSGLENYWDYASASLGREGTANVNLYNGNLIYTHTDVSKNNNIMPVTVAHVFNSNTKNVNDSKMLYGNGWRTNYDQRLTIVSIAGTSYYKYVDGDGTEHYFVYTDNRWLSEDGLDLELHIDPANSVTITDKQDNNLVFYLPTNAAKPGFLNYIEDNNGNTQTVLYDGNNRIRGIAYSGGEVLFQRDANNYLYKIREEVSGGTYRDTTFSYSNSRLVTITYPDASQTHFTYDANGNIDYVTGIDGKKIDLSYLSTSPYRVSYMGESSATENGAEASFSYNFNLTTLTDSEGRETEYQFNNYGNTVCVIAPDGSAQYAKFGTTSLSGDMSKITSASDTQKFGKNYLKNHGFETQTDWGWQTWGSSVGTHSYTTEEKYLGNYSFKLTKSNTDDKEAIIEEFTLERGKTYTLSGYIKTNNVSVSSYGVFLRAAGDDFGVNTELVTGTTDWTRYSVSFTIPSNSASSTAYIYAFLWGSTGTAYFDCLQLEEGSIANRYNIIDNADFDYATSGNPDKWTKMENCGASEVVISTSDSSNPSYMSDSRFQIIGDPASNKCIGQTIALSGVAGDCYIAGAWGKGNSVRLTGDRRFGIAVYIDYTDPQYADKTVEIPFSECTDKWQYVCSAIVAEHDYQSITVYAEYDKNANTAEYDGIQLFKEAFGNTYSYDADGNIVSVKDAGNREEQFEYVNNNLTKYTDPQGKEFTYTYDGNHNLLTATSAEGIVYTYTYDAYGNVTSAKVGDASSNICASVSYTGNGNYLDYATDPFGNQTDFSYDSYKGTLSSVTDPLGNTANYSYNSNTDLLTGVSMTSIGITVSNSYTYTNDYLTGVSHNTSSAGTVDYTISYNTLGWNTGTSVGAQSLITNSLEDQTGRLNSATYGNGQTISYSYDAYDRVIKISQGATDLYSYEYDNSGNVGYMKDYVQSAEYWYEYDSLNRLGKVTKKDSAGTCTTDYSYNNVDSVASFKEMIYGTSYETTYTYDDDGRAEAAAFGSYSTNNLYDAVLGTLTGVTLKDGVNTIYSTSIDYEAGDGTNSLDSGRISSITNGSETLSYTYDDRGYITRVQKDANNYSEYRYDAFGQLVRENYLWGGTSYTKLYTYDAGGNILSKKQYAFVAGDGFVGPISYMGHVQDIGWMDWKDQGSVSGTEGRDLRLEALKIQLNGLSGGVQYRTHVQNIGWMDWVSDGQVSGTEGQGLRAEAVQIQLTGQAAIDYDVYYRAYVQGSGWQDWVKNSETAGTVGLGYRMEAYQIVLVTKGGPAPSATSSVFGTIYTYDATWKDKLASYDGVSISYDNIGNPTDDGTWEYTWTQGRKLQQMTDGSTTLSFKYNSSGIRTEKTVGGTTTKYNIAGGKITWEKTGANNPIYYLYDSAGSLWGLKYTDGNTYFYVYNAQGDIIKILNSSGGVVVEYGYDAWGKPMYTSGSMSATLGADNPFRYRAYYYDDETGLYYIISRYYDPQIGRWLNADFQLVTSSLNQFKYCVNNPVNKIDFDGRKPYDLFDTTDAAAVDFGEYIFNKSVIEDREYGTVILEVNQKVVVGCEFLYWEGNEENYPIVKKSKFICNRNKIYIL